MINCILNLFETYLVSVLYAAKHTLFPVIPTRNTRPITVLWPLNFGVLPRLTTSKSLPEQGLSRVFHVCCTSLPRVPSVLVRAPKFWAVQNFSPRLTPFRSFPTSCHVYNAAVACLQREQHRLFHVRLLFDVFWPWLSRQDSAVRPGLYTRYSFNYIQIQ